ncbi:MAG: protein kinase [Candidatus Sericytochromatia bacterium]
MDNSILDYQEKIGKYLITQELGRGASGIVYKSKDLEIGRFVAIKKLILDENLSQNIVQEKMFRFNREAVTLASLSHPNIISVIEILKSNNAIVMELLDGKNLDIYKKYNNLSIDNILYIFIQIAEALEYIHSKGIIHRDIKPENIMILSNNKVKITDFGISINNTNRELFSNELLTGTISYMSPEQLYGKEPDFKSDIFSFGVLMYEILTGKLPFKGNTAKEIITNIFFSTPIEPQNIRTNVSNILSDIILKCLEKAPNDRYQGVKDIIDKLSFERIRLNALNLDIHLGNTKIKDTQSSSLNFLQKENIKKDRFQNYDLIKEISNYSESKRTGILTIISDFNKAEVFFREGNIISCYVDYKNLNAIDAFFELIIWESGKFNFKDIEVSKKSEFEFMPTNLLILKAKQVLNEYHELIDKYLDNQKIKFIGDINNIHDLRTKELIALLNKNIDISNIHNRLNIDKLSVLRIFDSLNNQKVLEIT